MSFVRKTFRVLRRTLWVLFWVILALLVFVLAGGGAGIPVFRTLQKRGIPFSCGILSENDVDYQIARVLAQRVVSVPAFSRVGEEAVARACEELARAGKLYVACTAFGECNA